MKRVLLTVMATLALSLLSALSEVPANTREMDYNVHYAGALVQQLSNYGIISSPDGLDKLISTSALWVSGKKYRRDADGNLLYWLSPNPSASNPQTVTQSDPLWNPSLQVVVDSLTTVGFDGDQDLYELLPAHNPLSWQNPYYEQYNAWDHVLLSFEGLPAPREFVYPDPEGHYCYTYPQGGTLNTPALETLSAFYYDACPFGTAGDRDLGSSHNQSTHYPLGLAVRQHSYAWGLEGLERCVIVKRVIYNTSLVDTLFDVAIGEFVDADVMPAGYDVSGAADDVSGYVKGAGWNFAYTRDLDGDGGLSQDWIAVKTILPGGTPQHYAWYWRVGDGPNDPDVRSWNFAPHLTPNEKFWLMTGRQADDTKYVPLIPQQAGISHYEQPSGNDTRFLYALCGTQPTAGDPDPAGRLNLLPGMGKVTYTVYFTGTSLDDLKTRSQALEDFIAGGLVVNVTDTLTCIPYLVTPLPLQQNAFDLEWHSYTDPTQFRVQCKETDDPNATWTDIALAGTERAYTLSGIDPDTSYDIRVAAVYTQGQDETVLYSRTYIVTWNWVPNPEGPLPVPTLQVKAWPNPFNPSTTIGFSLPQAGKAVVMVYNARGQLVRNLIRADLAAGDHSLVWDGTDSAGTPCASGVYLLRVKCGKGVGTAKLLMLK